MKTIVKTMCIMLVLLACGQNGNSQNKYNFYSLKDAIIHHGEDRLPVDEKNWNVDYNILTHYNPDTEEEVYLCFNELGSWYKGTDSYIRMVFSVSPETYLCGINSWNGDYNSCVLILVSQDMYQVSDKLFVGNAFGLYPSHQFLIREGDGEKTGVRIYVYSFIPEGESNVDLMNFSKGNPSSVRGRIKLQEYEVNQDRFTLINTSVSSVTTIRHSDFESGLQLWDLF